MIYLYLWVHKHTHFYDLYDDYANDYDGDCDDNNDDIGGQRAWIEMRNNQIESTPTRSEQDEHVTAG